MSLNQPSRAPLSQQQQQRPLDQKPQKLRLSCDACAAAKVKCGKERPRCERCNISDLNCVYGPSLKHGKPEKKRKLSDPQPSTTSPSSASTANFQDIAASPSNQTSYSDLHRPFSDLLQNIGSPHSLGTYPWNSNNQSLFATLTPESCFPPLGEQLWSDDITNSGDRGPGSLTPPRHALHSSLGLSHPPNSMLSSLDFSQQFIDPDSSNSISSPSNSTSYSRVGAPDFVTNPRQTSAGAHDCYMVATSTLATLHYRSRSLHSNGSDLLSSLYTNPPTIFPTTASAIQTLDDVLRSNQEAVSNVFDLLRCSCARESHMAMLYASIIVKVLFWHQVAAGTRGNSSRLNRSPEWLPSPADSPTGVLSSGSRKSPCLSAAPFISSEPIKIGTYTPDEEDQEPIRRLFLLSNLKKTGRLIEAFAAMGEDVEPTTRNLYASLALWLKSEFSRIIKDVGSGVKGSTPSRAN